MIVSRPWEPQDLIDDLQMLIDEEPDNYLNFRRTTMCTARDYLKEHFAEPRWISVEERLPTEADANPYESVLAIAKDDGFARSWVWDLVERYPNWFTHWMPLPKPPTEVEV